MKRVAALALLCLSFPASADVVIAPPQGYTDEETFGEASVDVTYRTPNGVPYRRDLGSDAGVTSAAVGWSPKNLPIYLETGVDARGRYIFMSSLLPNPGRFGACWTELKVIERGTALQARLARELGRWVRTCSTTRALGAERVIRRWAAARGDLSRALSRFRRIEQVRFLPITYEDEDRMFGLPSFLPTKVDQSILDAVADECGLPRSHLRLVRGAITFARPLTDGHETEADAKVETCVVLATENLPGYQRDTPAR